MKFDSNSIATLIEKESSFFHEILNEYNFYLKVGNLPDGKWFDILLKRRQKHIDNMKFIFNNSNYRKIFQNEIPEKIRTKFQKVINEILTLDLRMKELLIDLQNKKSEQLVKIKKVNKLLVQKTENNSNAKVVNITVK